MDSTSPTRGSGSVASLARTSPLSSNAVDMGYGYSLGVIYEGDGPEPGGLPGDFGWAGYFDTEFVVSPRSGLVAVIMAQEEPGPTTPDNPGARSVFKPMLYDTLGESSETG